MIETIESLAKSKVFRSGDLNDALREILERSSGCLDLERINIWLFDKKYLQISCIGNYIRSKSQFSVGGTILKEDIPTYFSHILKEELVVSNDVRKDPLMKELLHSYSIPNNIFSLLDVPFYQDGKLKGLVCFEQTGAPRTWNEQEQKFALSIAQLVSLCLENDEKRRAQKELRNALKEKEALLAEIHHRVKNNMMILVSLLRLQAEKSKLPQAREQLEDCKDRIFSMAKIHDQLYLSKSFSNVDFKSYLNELVDGLMYSHQSSETEILVSKKTDQVFLDISTAITFGLMVNEILTNCFKHAFKGRTEGKIDVELLNRPDNVFLRISDNGRGFDPKTINMDNSLGFTLIQDLAGQLEASIELESSEGTTYSISVPVKPRKKTKEKK